MSSWFETEQIDKSTYRISEPRHSEETNCWLLEGAHRALLIDTGLGISDMGAVVRSLTAKPVAALASHVHWDHIGGHRCFGEFFVHEAERPWIEEAFPIGLGDVLVQLRKGGLPEDFDPEGYTLFRGTPSRLLCDGDTIDLGGRSLEVVHSPGHSPGHICLWEGERGWLFTGDTVYKGIIYADYPSTDPEALLGSVERLAEYPVKRIFPAHHDTEIDPNILPRMAEELRRLKAKGLLRHGGGLHNFGDWGIKL